MSLKNKFSQKGDGNGFSYQRKENPKGTLIDMFKGIANIDADTIIAIYEIDKDFDNAVQRCHELFGYDAQMADTVSRFRQEFAHENSSDSEESEEEKEEVKMPSQLHRRVINHEEQKIKDVPP